jgi:type IV pilus assembly protein PilX
MSVSCTRPGRASARNATQSRQSGVILIVALIVLAAMTLAGIALIRSTSTGNRVAGNLAFQQSATLSADTGVEAAIAWLELNKAGSTLHQNSVTQTDGYVASRSQDPTGTQSWDTWWTTNAVNTGYMHTMATDAAGNTVRYIINRLCNAGGDPASGIGCAVAPAVVGSEGNSKGSGVLPVKLPTQQYYRITARVDGPRNTVSFVQVVVAL